MLIRWEIALKGFQQLALLLGSDGAN